MRVKPLPSGPISFEEFLDWCDEDTRAEWVNGKVVLLSPASSPHQLLVSFLDRTLGVYVHERSLGVVYVAPFVMLLEKNGREPDLVFISRALLPFVHRNFFYGPADLAIEIISPESVTRDRVEKFAEYAAAGVREYWLIDPDEQLAEFYELHSGEPRYERLPVDEHGIFRSRVVDGFFLRLEWLWKLPSSLNVLVELGILGLSDGSDGGR
jgi:Uma2 family endonuclease